MRAIQQGSVLEFPTYSGIRVQMLPYTIGDYSTLPGSLVGYIDTIRQMESFGGWSGTGYLTIDECRVTAGESHRRPGAHVDAGGWGGGDKHGGGGGCSGFIIASSTGGTRLWDNLARGGRDGAVNAEGFGSGHISLPGTMYRLHSNCVHEALPEARDTVRQFIRLSGPNGAPWASNNSRWAVNPDGPTVAARGQLNYRKGA